jgi:hypothetical protein
MSKIISVLTSRADDSPYFVVDTGKLRVAFTPAETDCLLCDSEGNSQFEAGDNINILTIGVSLPLQFCLHNEQGFGLAQVLYAKKINNTIQVLLDEFNGNESINIPFDTSHSFVNCFIDCVGNGLSTGLDVTGFGFWSNIVTGQYISMVGVPTPLDEAVFSAKLFMVAEHNLPIFSLPIS